MLGTPHTRFLLFLSGVDVMGLKENNYWVGGRESFLIKKLFWRAGDTEVIFRRLLLLDRSYLRVERDLGLLLRQFHPTPSDFGLALSGHRNNDVYPP